jgi:hypothetical protein
MADNEFDKFLSEREARQNQTRSAEEVVVQRAAAEWQNLKDATKALISGKTVEGNRLEWRPYSACYPDFLQLKNVAAIFIDRGIRNGVPQACSIRFDRNASSPQGMFLEDKSPVAAEVWSLEPRSEGHMACKRAGQELHLVRVGFSGCDTACQAV